MLYSTFVKRDETGLNQIFEAAREFDEKNVLDAILDCKFTLKEVAQTLECLRMYQSRLNIESMDLIEFSETFIEQYATDHNECFRVAEKLLRRIRTTITGSIKLFRQFCPRVRYRYEERGRVVPVLDYSLLTSHRYHGHLFPAEIYDGQVQTLIHELAAFFYHLLATLKVCKDMIHKEEVTRGDFNRLKEIYEKSCENELKSLRDVFDSFGEVKLISDEELEKRRKNARPMKEWLAREYHTHDRQWMKRQAYFHKLTSGSRYGLDEKASVLWAENPEWGREVCAVIPQLDTLDIPFRRSKKASDMGKTGTFTPREMAYLVKWSGVSRVSADGKIHNEAHEKQFYLYLRSKYNGDYLLPTWTAVCGERRLMASEGVTQLWMAEQFARHLPPKESAA